MAKNSSEITWRRKFLLIIGYIPYKDNNPCSDYRPMPGLDRYDPNMLDEDDYDAMSPGTRAAVEQELRRRDRDLGGRRGLEYGKLLCLSIIYVI